MCEVLEPGIHFYFRLVKQYIEAVFTVGSYFVQYAHFPYFSIERTSLRIDDYETNDWCMFSKS